MSIQVQHEEKQRPFSLLYHDIVDYEFPTGHCKLVYMSLLRFADSRSGEAYPSVERLAKICQCTDRTVQKSLKQLEENGFIVRQPRKTTTLYTLLKRDWTNPSPENNSGVEELSPENISVQEPKMGFSPEDISGQESQPRKYFTHAPKNFHPSPENISGKQYHLTITNNNIEKHVSQDAKDFWNDFQGVITFQTNVQHTQAVDLWTQQDGIEYDALRYALEFTKEGCQNTKKAWNYFKSIVDTWTGEGIKTRAQAKAREDKRKVKSFPKQQATGNKDWDEEKRKIMDFFAQGR